MRQKTFLALALAGVLVPAAVSAQPKPAPAKPAAPAPAKDKKGDAKVDVAPIVQKLRSGDASQIREALDEARIAGPGGAAAAPAVAEVLGRGLPLPLTESAIETLADLEAEAGTPAIPPYVSHRTTKVRRSAVKALARTKGAGASAALRRALSDQDAVVRGNAASGLGALKAKDAVGDLFTALDHRVNEAASSIGTLCGPTECDQLAGKLGRLPFDVMSGGFEQILFRPTTDVTDDGKIKVIGKVRELGTPEANKFLRDVAKRLTTASPRLKQSLDQAIQATGGGQ